MLDIFLKQVSYGFSQKPDKNMRVFLDENKNKETAVNRKEFFKKNRINYSSLVFAELVHESNLKIVTIKHKNKIIKKTDALITNDPGICLALTAADCLIIYVYDKKHKVIALIHAGWRGLLKEIIKKTIREMKTKFHSQTKDMLIYISPHIQDCHFIIKEDILDMFKKYQSFVTKSNKIRINLSGIAKEQLIKEKILNKNIQMSSECTYCLNNKYFSYRHSQDKKLKTMIAYLSLKK